MIGRWYLAFGINVLLGVPGVVPLWMLYFIATTWVRPAPEENDGFAVVLIGFGTPVALCGFLWWLANRPFAHRTRLRPTQYWTLSLLGTLAPTLMLVGVDVSLGLGLG